VTGKTYNTDDEPFAKRGTWLDVVSSRNNSEDVEHNERTDRGDQVDRTSTKLINQKGKEEVLAQRQRLHTTIYTELCLWIRQAHIIHDIFEVIRDETVATPLTEEANRSDDDDPLAVAFCLQEVGPVGSVLFLVKSNSSAHLGVFKLNKLVVRVSFAMPAGEHGEGFFVAIFVAQPTWRFRHEENEAEDDEGAD
jgi:hypothetical protein